MTNGAAGTAAAAVRASDGGRERERGIECAPKLVARRSIQRD